MPEKELAWTTWEELLLASAVKRHGVDDWDSVAMELQSRSALSLLLTAQVCKNKFHDLKRRFIDHEHDEANTIPWLEELRKLRVDELKQEVLRSDLSIQSLQSKVKSLEEDRERSLKNDGNGDGKPDLEEDSQEERSENDKNDGAGGPEEDSPEHAAGECSDRENRSFNESNSTGNRGREPEPVETVDVKPDPASSDSKPTGNDSCNDSSDTVAKLAAAKSSLKKKGGDSAELRNSAGESTEGMKESSDVQSTASLTRRRRREKEFSGGGGGDEPVVSPATIKREVVKSEPLVGLLDIIRSHKRGSVFERRLDSQKTDEYKNMVRHHVDLETIRTRLNKGSYTSSTNKFYRDLLLLLNNAVVFFPKPSTESVTAYELRELVLEQMKKKKKTQRPDSPDPDPDPAPSGPTIIQPKPDPERPESLLVKHNKSSAPIVVCRKRSSISAKASEEKANITVKSSPTVKEEQSPTKAKMREGPVTGARSSRRNKNTQTITNPSSIEKGGDSKTDKKEKIEVAAAVKKRGAADFLKRIKRNSPAKGAPLLETLKSRGSEGDTGGGRKENKRGEGRKEATASKRGGGGGGKAVKEESSPSKRGVGRPPKKGAEAAGTKRGREGGGAPEAKKRPRR